MNKNFKKAVWTILEAVNSVKWELDALKIAVRKLNTQYETFTCVRIAGPIIDEWTPAEIQKRKQKEVITERLVEDMAEMLLKSGAIEIVEKPTDPCVHGMRFLRGTEYRATIRVVVPRKEEAQP